MLRAACWVLCPLFLAEVSYAQVYWRRDHIYSGPGGTEIAVVMPPPTDQIAPSTPTMLGPLHKQLEHGRHAVYRIPRR